MNYQNIPEVLRNQPNWVCRREKIPFNPRTGRAAKAGQPETWATFEESVNALPQYDGIGFEFDGNGIIGVDFDHCIENGQLAHWVAEWVERFNSYTEISPSGTGIHIICMGTLNGKPSRKRKEVEIYDRARYFTMTGNPLDHVRPLQNAQDALDALYQAFWGEDTPTIQTPVTRPLALDDDEALLDKIKQSKTGAHFTELWNGSTAGYGSHSEADIALCNILAFWTQRDTERIDRLFRRSGLMREKWDEKRSGGTYGAKTIARAIADCRDTYEAYRITVGRTEPEKTTVPAVLDENGRTLLTIPYLENFLHGLGLTVRNNLLSKRMEFSGDLCGISRHNAANAMPSVLSDLLKQGGVKCCETRRVQEFLACIADKNRYNPIQDYLRGLEWDKQNRFPLLCQALGIQQESQYAVYLKKWLLQCCAMGLNDEDTPIGAEGVLVLSGAQGLGKTAFFRNLCPQPDWFIEGASIDTSTTGGGKDSLIRSTSGWICELGELDSTTKREQPALKAFITAPFDQLRMPYAAADVRTPRRTSFCGSVNGDAFLADATGSRRFWVVPVERMDKDIIFNQLPHENNQIWAQAYQLYLTQPSGFRLTEAELAQLQASNRAFETVLPYEEEIRALLDWKLPFPQWKWWSVPRLKASGLLFYPPQDSVKVGRALSSIVKDITQDYNTNLIRISRGCKQYFIPLKAS